jgi:hypothetical protein
LSSWRKDVPQAAVGIVETFLTMDLEKYCGGLAY